MTLRSFLYREVRWVRHNWRVLAVVLILVPALFAVSTGAFEQALPRDTPVAVVPGETSVTDDELTGVTGVAALFSRPHEYDSEAAAMRALAREEVYAVFVVPHGLFDADRSVTVEMVVEAEMVPYEQPSIAIANILRDRIGEPFPADVSVTRTTVGNDRTLSEFLLGAVIMLIAMLYAFVYLPQVVTTERGVFRRVRVESSLWRLLGAKFAVFSVLVVMALATIEVVATNIGRSVSPLAPGAVAPVLAIFLALAAIAVGVTFLSSFRPIGRIANAGVLVGAVVFANLVYPAGFFSPLRGSIARLNPIHHAMTIQRGVSLKGHPPGLYADRYALLVGFLVLAGAFLAVSILTYRRRAKA
jgi:ABC-2 type transport system permease protein